ncbi:MAG: IclR family transcriptional regulator [Nitriliruptor sp.]|nr:MAG: IclR family transcriptional regulator [Nitriliruptor sp.]
MDANRGTGTGSVQVPAAVRTLAILRYLAAQARPVTAGAIGRDLAIPRSSLYHLLTTLEREGFVAHVSPPGRYELGVAAFELGSAYQRQAGLERLGRPLLARLVARTGCTGHLGILDDTEVVYLIREDPRDPLPLITEVGVRLPAHLTASGRCLLAARSLLPVEATYSHRTALTSRTGRGPKGLTNLRRQLVLDRRRGWSLEDGEVTEGFASIAAAARSHGQRPAASIGLTFPSERLDEPGRAELATEVVRTADRLTARLRGWSAATRTAPSVTASPDRWQVTVGAPASGADDGEAGHDRADQDEPQSGEPDQDHQ